MPGGHFLPDCIVSAVLMEEEDNAMGCYQGSASTLSSSDGKPNSSAQDIEDNCSFRQQLWNELERRLSSNPNDYTIQLGRYKLSILDDHTIASGVSEIVIHPLYNGSAGLQGDIALVKLSSPVPYTKYILPICLPSASVTFSCGLECWVTGWGTINSGVDLPYPKTLQKVMTPIIDRARCDGIYHVNSFISTDVPIILDDMICSGYRYGGKDSCQGDSGGPLVCKVQGVWYQAGVVSWGDGCALSNRPGVYTLVTAYTSWIQSYVPDVTFSDLGYLPPPSIDCDTVIGTMSPTGKKEKLL
ncbi:mast cell tryptase-like [Phyllobates terribilis]|uniref:mast cell tryptase-like n=1 Tax=Phyllobates terribilis TaxID=111132 RepID=UPI003CCB106D